LASIKTGPPPFRQKTIGSRRYGLQNIVAIHHRPVNRRPGVGYPAGTMRRPEPGPTVIFTDKEHGQFPESGQIHGLMNTALRRGPVSKKDHRDKGFMTILLGKGRSHGQGGSGPDDRTGHQGPDLWYGQV
jgi:hypothetical protein